MSLGSILASCALIVVGADDPATNGAAERTLPRLIIVTPRAADVDFEVEPLVELFVNPLRSQSELIPLEEYERAATELGIRGKDLYSVDAALIAGSTLYATHVLILAGEVSTPNSGDAQVKPRAARGNGELSKGKRKKNQRKLKRGGKKRNRMAARRGRKVRRGRKARRAPQAIAEAPEAVENREVALVATLVDVTGGTVLLSDRVVLTERRPTSTNTFTMLTKITDRLTGSAAARQPALASDLSTGATVVQAAEPLDGEGAIARDGPVRDPVVLEREDPAPPRPPRWREPFDVRGGAYVFWRDAEVTDPASTPAARYQGSVMMTGALQGQVYPLAVRGTGKPLEGIGAHAELLFSQVNTANERTGASTKSTIFGVRGGLSYRFVFWDSTLAPDVRAHVGYGYLQFPLQGVGFPGVTYDGPYVGAAFLVPLGQEYASLQLDGRFLPFLRGGGDMNEVGQNPTANGFDLRGGIRLALGVVRADLGFRFDQRTTRVSGASTFVDFNPDFRDATFKNITYGPYALLGIEL